MEQMPTHLMQIAPNTSHNQSIYQAIDWLSKSVFAKCAMREQYVNHLTHKYKYACTHHNFKLHRLSFLPKLIGAVEIGHPFSCHILSLRLDMQSIDARIATTNFCKYA